MVKCAKCGYEGEGDSCARCGVIFSRLRPGTPQGSARSAGPRRTAHRQPKPPSAPAFSFLNVIVLASVLVLVGAAAWHFVERASQRSTEQSPVATTPKLEGGSLTSSADVPIGGEITELSGGGAVLSMPGFAGGETTGDEIMMPPAGAKVSLRSKSCRPPRLRATVSLATLSVRTVGDSECANRNCGGHSKGHRHCGAAPWGRAVCRFRCQGSSLAGASLLLRGSLSRDPRFCVGGRSVGCRAERRREIECPNVPGATRLE